MDADRSREKAPRRLRLDELLADLGARGVEPPIALPDGSGAAAPIEPDERKPLTVGELVDKAAEAGFGFLVAILALIAIPFFGLSTPFGLAIALVGAQMTIGLQHPWLPQRARRRTLSMPMLDKVASMVARRTRWIAKSTRRRWESWLQPRLIGFGIVLLALGLALPLPIPGSNLVFLVPILIYAIGLLERDGLWIAIGHACLVVDIVLMFVFAKVVWMTLLGVYHWLF